MHTHRSISFSPPDISQAELDAVVDALKSGWITTGPRTKQFENELAAFFTTPKVAALNSCTAALECALRVLSIGAGDEVITSAYTYTATAAAICHVGATPILCDVAANSYEMNYDALPALITPRTKAVIPVDIAGVMIDYDRLFDCLAAESTQWTPANDMQAHIGRIAVIADGAHSCGAARAGRMSGSVADLTALSFHAVKNLTTGEGGALTWRAGLFDDEALYNEIMLLSLHGQTKDALHKNQAGAWEYDIMFPGWKCNMPEMAAALGRAQLKRYPTLLARRRSLVARYETNFAHAGFDASELHLVRHYALGTPTPDASKATTARNATTAPDASDTPNTVQYLSDKEAFDLREREAHATDGFASSGHLMLCRFMGMSREFCNELITRCAQAGIACNVHYKPLPLLTAYKNLGFTCNNYPHAYAQYENEITLPLHTLLSDDDVDYICDVVSNSYRTMKREGLR